MSSQNFEFPHRHILSTEQLTAEQTLFILDLAQDYIGKKGSSALKGLTQINLFFENSTRTSISFEIAGKRLGADVLSFIPETSSLKKGETLLDTATTLNAMKPDILVVRHQDSGASSLLAQKVDCAVINAGDGAHQHPTQALIDALAIKRRKGRIAGLTIAICGDILHSRVARSNIYLLKTLGADIRLIAPSSLLPQCATQAFEVEVFHHMDEGLKDCDIVMMLRLQKERMEQNLVASEREYFQLYGLSEDLFKHAKPDALIMHPGPMNRGVEISSPLADDSQKSLIQEQVELGVAVRMAALDILTKDLRKG